MTPAQLKDAILSAPVIARFAKAHDIGQEVKEIHYVEVYPGRDVGKIFAVFVKVDFDTTVRLFATNTGGRSYMRYLKQLWVDKQPENIEEWGWGSLEEIRAFRNKAAF